MSGVKSYSYHLFGDTVNMASRTGVCQHPFARVFRMVVVIAVVLVLLTVSFWLLLLAGMTQPAIVSHAIL